MPGPGVRPLFLLERRAEGGGECGRTVFTLKGTPFKLEVPELVGIGTLMFFTSSGNEVSGAKVILASGK